MHTGTEKFFHKLDYAQGVDYYAIVKKFNGFYPLSQSRWL